MTAPRGCSGCWPPGSPCCSGSSCSSAFTSYDDSKSGSEAEALAVVQQFETAQFLPTAARGRLGGELICYGRSVIGQEWPRMRAGSETGAVNPWGLALFRTMQAVEPATAAEQSAYDKWFDLTSTREEARRDRVHASEGVIPTPLWRVLFFIAAIILVYMLPSAGALKRTRKLPWPGAARPR